MDSPYNNIIKFNRNIECPEEEEMEGGMNTLFSRMGGKRKLALRLIPLFPDDYKTFVEPFVGAGNIFFRVKQKPDVKYVINDKDPTPIKIYRGIVKHPEKFVITHYPTREEFNKMKNKPHKTDVEEYTLIKASFFGQGRSWIKSHYKYADGYTPVPLQLKKLMEAQPLLSNATILNEDFTKVIKKYDSASTFFYLDPPYESTEQKDYKDYVTPEQVYNAVKNIKGRFLLSYNKSPKIVSLFKQFKIREIKTEYSQTPGLKIRDVVEVIISNY